MEKLRKSYCDCCLVINLLLVALSGIFLVCVGFSIYEDKRRYLIGSYADDNYTELAETAWIFGLAVISVCVVAIMGMTLRITAFFWIVIMGLLVSIGFEIDLGIQSITAFEGIEGDKTKYLYESISKYGEARMNTRSDWDNFQSKYHCCGVSDANDWINLGYPTPPASCCANQPRSTEHQTTGCFLMHSRGCDGVFEKEIERSLIWLIAATFCGIAAQLVAVIAALRFMMKGSARSIPDEEEMAMENTSNESAHEIMTTAVNCEDEEKNDSNGSLPMMLTATVADYEDEARDQFVPVPDDAAYFDAPREQAANTFIPQDERGATITSVASPLIHQ